MFLASPSFFWNSLKRLTPKSASRMISIDHQSPIASSERAIGQSSSSKLVRFTMAISGDSLSDAFSSREPDSTSLENALGDHVWLHYKTRCPRWQISLISQPMEAP